MKVKAIVTFELPEVELELVDRYVKDAISTYGGCYDKDDAFFSIQNTVINSIEILDNTFKVGDKYIYTDDDNELIVKIVYKSDQSILIRFDDNSEDLLLLEEAKNCLFRI